MYVDALKSPDRISLDAREAWSSKKAGEAVTQQRSSIFLLGAIVVTVVGVIGGLSI